MNRLVVVRHAQSDHHVRGLTGGWTDTGLTALGQAQARQTAYRCRTLVADDNVSLFTSDLQRAYQTATLIAEALAVPTVALPGLREINNGVAANLLVSEAKALELPKTDPVADWVPYTGAESWNQMVSRVFAAMEQIHTTTTDTALVVTHGLSGCAVIQWWLGLGPCCRANVSFQLDPASISLFGVNSWNERTVVKLNDTSHLDNIDPASF